MNCIIGSCDKKIHCKKMCKFHYNEDYYFKNKKSILIQKSTYTLKNRDLKKIYDKAYLLNNKEKIAKDRVEYFNSNKEKINLKRKIYFKLKRKNDSSYALRKDISKSILTLLIKQSSSKKGKSVLNHFSYSIEELKQHLESLFEPWMTWSNRGVYNLKSWNDDDQSTWTWQLDHIVPQSKLPYSSMEEENFKKCWALENLRPLSSKQNVFDGNRR